MRYFIRKRNLKRGSSLLMIVSAFIFMQFYWVSSGVVQANSYQNDYLYFTTIDNGAHQLARVKPDGTSYSLIGTYSDANVSPNGTKLAYSNFINDPSGCDLHISNQDGSNPVNITNSPTICEYQPIWSPDGTKLLYSTNIAPDYNDLTLSVINSDGTSAHSVVTGITSDNPASWLSDGSKIVFEYDPPEDTPITIGTVNTDGSNFHLYETDGNDWTNPIWSPDGTKLSFLSTVRDPNATYIPTTITTMNVDSTNKVALYTSTQNNNAWRMAWSPDSSLLAFISDDMTGANITKIKSIPANGGAVSEIYDSGLRGVDSLQWWHEPESIPDNTSPIIQPHLSPTPNAGGWNNSTTTLAWNVSDSESSITNQTGCDLVTINTNTNGTTYTCTATSSGGTNTNSVTIKFDKTLPTTTTPILNNSAPIPFVGTPIIGSSTSVKINVADNLSGVAKAEYYVDTDPGLGNGTPMTISGNVASAIVSNLTVGSHVVYVRALDNAGNWSITKQATVIRII